MVNRERDRRGPPYVSYKSWETFLARLRTEMLPLPQRLDTSIWRRLSFSGATESAVKTALVFLGLTSPDYQPNPRLERLLSASDEERRRIQRALIEERYDPLLEGIDLERATRGEVREAFLRAGSGQETSDKAVSFFVSFAQDAGLRLHQNLTSRTPPKRSRKSVSAQKIRGKSDAENGETDTTNHVPRGHSENGAALADIHPSLWGLLKELPKLGEGWSSDRKAAFQRAFVAILDVVYPPTEERGATGL